MFIKVQYQGLKWIRNSKFKIPKYVAIKDKIQSYIDHNIFSGTSIIVLMGQGMWKSSKYNRQNLILCYA